MNLKKKCVASFAMLFCLSASPLAEEFTFTDVTGQKIVLKAQPERIVTLPNPAAPTFIAIEGSSKRIVGMNQGSKRAFNNGMMSVMFPEALDISSDVVAESGGWMPNVEGIAALEPDLVIQWGGRGDDLIAPLRNAGIPVALMVGGGNNGTEELARENMRMAAEITGQTEKYNRLIEWRDEVINEITSALAAADIKDKPSILHLRSAKSRLRATGEKSWQQTFIELVGAVNVADGVGVEKVVSIEQILEWDPDIIMLSSEEIDAGLEVIYDHPLFSQLTAAKEKRVYKTPVGGYIWDSASHESPFTWMWLANLTHPEIFQFDLRAELPERFQLLYNYALSEAEIDQILRVEMNGEARGYQVFSKK
ncbi:corrinoid ABC transporter substrate-binding protein [Oligella ureolytica]|uniref:ABC transporter substrate-binding protein n=1 Tax=Oligella ureolytica TaxID=90244 RepID=A0A378XIK2_9BURK|nr:ABC transporter substrate-binding protein [Oligella ureolytica]QPT39684.1 ABC transporter substrate-binding protein [Oligella ureolytica]SUA52441.1 corrinoid ABC transporter substrate-binding protein [Oligella ureolytica]SUA57185.1 corrinoid ABC transporter substrate-binding protein [Oligella ureolytica]